MLIYICSPYTPNITPTNKEIKDHDGKVCKDTYKYYRDQNIQRANEAGKQILLKGHIPLIPHNNTAGWEDDARFENFNHKRWIDVCLVLLEKCDAILMCHGWMSSRGCQMELEFFVKNFNRYIFYDMDAVVKVDKIPD